MTLPPLKRMVAARAGLLLDEPFFGVPALRLKVVEDPTCKTAWVDGQSLGFNPTFIGSCTPAELKGLWIHEVEHCAMGHPWRRDGRDPEQWNEAADRAINPVLRDAGYSLPEGGLFELEPGHKGKSAEWIYARLPVKPKKGKGGSGGSGGEGGGSGDGEPQEQQKLSGATADGKPNPLGEVRDAPVEGDNVDDAPPTESDWQQIMEQAAAMARGQGKLPAALDRAMGQITKSRRDWRSPMRRFAQEAARADYSWARPSPRYLARGLYLPSLRSQEVGVVAIGVDTSGSIDKVLLSQFEAEVRAVVDEVRPRQVHVFYADATVQRVDVFEQDDLVKLNPAGGGGTDFRPVFDAARQMEEPPVCVIYLTDLAGTFPEEDPGIPTLWVTGRDEAASVPFGEVLTAN